MFKHGHSPSLAPPQVSIPMQSGCTLLDAKVLVQEKPNTTNNYPVIPIAAPKFRRVSKRSQSDPSARPLLLPSGWSGLPEIPSTGQMQLSLICTPVTTLVPAIRPSMHPSTQTPKHHACQPVTLHASRSTPPQFPPSPCPVLLHALQTWLPV
jgi:hypothetical protein